MSVEAIAVVLHHSRAKGADKLVLLGIANHEGDGGAWPSVATLARYANLEERSVQRSLKRLEALGEVMIAVQAGGPSGVPGWRRPNRYDVTVECPATCDRSRNHRLSDLWINRVTPTSPGDAHVTPRVTPTSPPPVTPTSPEPSIEPSMNPAAVDLSTTGRAREPICSICSLPHAVCVSRVATSGHEFEERAS